MDTPCRTDWMKSSGRKVVRRKIKNKDKNKHLCETAGCLGLLSVQNEYIVDII